jgi:hypothetical protein
MASTSLYAARSIGEVRKVAAWVEQLLEMDDPSLTTAELQSIALRWHQRSPEAPEAILERVENLLVQELFSGE